MLFYYPNKQVLTEVTVTYAAAYISVHLLIRITSV